MRGFAWAAAAISLLSLLTGCPPSTNPPPTRDPPQVFLTAVESNVVGTQVALTVNVTGCDQVQRLAIYDRSTFLLNVPYVEGATAVVLTSQALGALYPKLGIAADLSLVAEATCDDARTNVSTAAAVRFFPVEKVLSHPTGEQLVPDQFYAEGGLNGSDPTFVGCIGVPGGVALARVNSAGAVVGQNASLPFRCSGASQFTDKNIATGKRWMWERGVGALAFDGQLNVTASVVGPYFVLEAGPEGDAVVWDNKARLQALRRISHAGGAPVWTFQPAGIVTGSPKYLPNLNALEVPVFIDDMGTSTGVLAIEVLDYSNGVRSAIHNLRTFDYGFGNTPNIPPTVFSIDGSALIFPVDASSSTSAASTVLSCATNADGCAGPTLRWKSQLLEGQVLATLPLAHGSQLAAIAAQRLYVLDQATGAVKNKNGAPIVPHGSLVALGAQAGLAQDFYLLSGPANGYATELIGLDSAASGELFRYEMNGGTSPANSLTVAVDDAGRAWMRVGPNLVKPLPLSQYRLARGPTP